MWTKEQYSELFFNNLTAESPNYNDEMPALNHVLVADDDDVANFIHEDLIYSLQAARQVTVVLNGQEAIDVILNNPDNLPELIFLDINMPVMSGFDFLEIITEKAPVNYNPVILVMQTTPFTREDHMRMNSLKHLVRGFVDKPLTEQIIKTAIKKYF